MSPLFLANHLTSGAFGGISSPISMWNSDYNHLNGLRRMEIDRKEEEEKEENAALLHSSIDENQ